MNREHRVIRVRDQKEICTELEIAETLMERAFGLMGTESLRPGCGFLLRDCHWITTFFMRYPLTLIFLDAKNVIVEIQHAVSAWKFRGCSGARSVIEMDARNYDLDIGPGDGLEILK